jgi:hypothetical protein
MIMTRKDIEEKIIEHTGPIETVPDLLTQRYLEGYKQGLGIFRCCGRVLR